MVGTMVLAVIDWLFIVVSPGCSSGRVKQLFFNDTCTEQDTYLRLGEAGLTLPTPVEKKVWDLIGFSKTVRRGSCWHTIRPSAESSQSWTERYKQTTDTRDFTELWLCLQAPRRVQSLPFIH